MTDQPKSLADRLLAAARAMPDVEKTGKNANFSYAYLEDVNLTAHARKALLDAGIVVIQTVDGVEQKTITTERSTRTQTLVRWKFLLLAPGTSDRLEVGWASEAMDSSDKGVSKCATMARKDFYRTLLLVPGGAENEADSETDRASGAPPAPPTPEPVTEAQRGLLRRLAGSLGRDIKPPASKAEASKLIDELKAEETAKKQVRS